MSDEPQSVTMQMIADKAGVSRMAVSLALRNSPKISPGTRERIREIAEELGYRPNPLVSALMTQLRDVRRVPKQTTLAYITAYPTADGWRRPGPFVEFFEGAKTRAEALGYTLEEWWAARPGMSEQRLSDILYNRNIHGLLIAPLPAGGATIKLDWPRFCAATIGFSLVEPSIPRASNDQYQSIAVALQELTQLGYRRIGLAITEEEDARVQKKWSAGFLVYQQDVAPKQRVPALMSGPSFAPAFSDWYRKNKPDVVLSQEPRCIEYLQRLGCEVPRDCGFAHLALTDSDKGLAGIHQNGRVVGATMIDLVDAQLRRNERGVPPIPRTVLTQGRWMPGPTVCEVVARPAKK